ncbi:hypothetical protein BKE38_11355 [Pseudoroseomonas deserti]|uniref:DUF4412 domain-containing protein n=1 Tax=Teichococcus deserti TaxID=1817963 RepID=A0A1V2H315_9PROT|nr:DUF4412 domain-containing protein [Pseudoroseomonas deserti]ONG53807.1 hypothetical protein BKE38_11355 [Pseudoroseomonas deserti]
MLKPLMTAAALLALPTLAAAQAAPGLQPTRDVAVTYKMIGGPAAPGAAGAQDIRMAWSVAAGKQRVDPPGGMGWMLIDRKANSAVMVMEAQRSIMTMPPATVSQMTQQMPPDARFTRKGSATVAGLSCTEWDVVTQQVNTTLCVTDDGVMLRAAGQAPNGGGLRGMEATEVRYGTQDAARFTVPADYKPLQLGQMPGAAPGATPGATPGAAPAR